jgi:hypothetical protein
VTRPIKWNILLLTPWAGDWFLDVFRHGQVYEGVCSLALKGKREERGEGVGACSGLNMTKKNSYIEE